MKEWLGLTSKGCAHIAGIVVGFVIGLLICALLNSCSPKVTMRTENIRVDSAAVSRQVDASMNRWTQQTDSMLQQTLNLYIGWQLSAERQHETITESIVTSTDSAGREVRTENRTISRDVAIDRTQSEQAMSQELDSRVSTAIAAYDSIWSFRLDSMASVIAKHDSTYISQSDATAQDNRPWYKRWWSALKNVLAGIILGICLWFTIKNIAARKIPP